MDGPTDYEILLMRNEGFTFEEAREYAGGDYQSWTNYPPGYVDPIADFDEREGVNEPTGPAEDPDVPEDAADRGKPSAYIRDVIISGRPAFQAFDASGASLDWDFQKEALLNRFDSTWNVVDETTTRGTPAYQPDPAPAVTSAAGGILAGLLGETPEERRLRLQILTVGLAIYGVTR